MARESKRLQELSPERRKLVELLKARAASTTPAARATAEEPVRHEKLRLDYTTSSDQAKENYRQFYNGVSKQLDATVFGGFSYFLNYGYAADDSPQFSAVNLPEKYINRNSVKLVLETIGDCDLKGRRVLDVGCGRGGAIHVMHEFFEPASLTGVDLSAEAIQFCRKAHKHGNVSFHEGDAENLPWEDGSFDVVVNIESSHSYPNVRSFYMEAWRTLVPGGYLLYADVMSRKKSNEGLGIVRSLGFELEWDHDITNNVLLSCDEIAVSRVGIFQRGNDPVLMGNFLAAPGSQVYEEMKSGNWIYRAQKLRKLDP